MHETDHPCLIKLEDVIKSANGMLHMTLGLAQGGKLVDKIIEKRKRQKYTFTSC